MTRAEELATLEAIAREAAEIVARVYATEFRVDYKAPADPVTEADRQANALICERLAKAFPGVPVVAEESDEEAFDGWVGAERVLFVDPLDGTQEFIAKNGEFAVMIGLTERGRAVAGVVYGPAMHLGWTGAPGLGAWEWDDAGARRPIRVSGVTGLGAATLVASRSHRGKLLQASIDAMAPGAVSTLGSAGLKGAFVASGRADLYCQPGRAGKRWDACAPDAIVTAAGGRVTDAHGAPIDYVGGKLENDRGLVMSNDAVHEAALAAIGRAFAANGG